MQVFVICPKLFFPNIYDAHFVLDIIHLLNKSLKMSAYYKTVLFQELRNNIEEGVCTVTENFLALIHTLPTQTFF